MGQALYRKYRSKSLNEIVGQAHITDTLAKAVKDNRISHAYLFTGPRGVGKTSIARILAHEVNGLPYDEEQAHIDIIEIDAASNRRIDEIRELRDKIHVAPAIAKYKVYIIDEVHMLTREAFNALLKTLEEPPAHAIFILATTEAHKLPETITSRTQRYIFRPIDPAAAVKHLRDIATRESIDITDAALGLIAEHGNGSFRDSISLLDQLAGSDTQVDLAAVQDVLGVAPQEAVDELLRAVRSTANPAQTYALLADLLMRGYQAGSLSKQLAAALRKQLVTSSDITTNDLQLLKALLMVPFDHDPESQLEIAVLGYSAKTIVLNQVTVQPVPAISTPTPTGTKAKPVDRPAQESATPVVQPAKSTQPDPIVAPPAAPAVTVADEAVTAPEVTPSAAVFDGSAVLTPQTWQEVLNLLKKQANTLYGIVRMAQPDFSQPGSLLLTFGFAFHQKRANETKNKTLIGAAITTVIGADLEITCVYDSEAKTAQPVLATTPAAAAPAATDTANDPLSTISNIFGGVEMVE